MPTNEECREVARNIRNADLTKHASYYEEVKGWDHVRATRFVLVSNLGSAIGIDKAIFSIDDLKIRLADLIEPEPERTCHIVHDDLLSEQYYGPMARCSHCGAALPEEFIGPYYYCPRCGAKVIKE
jgi:hypothetical protein